MRLFKRIRATSDEVDNRSVESSLEQIAQKLAYTEKDYRPLGSSAIEITLTLETAESREARISKYRERREAKGDLFYGLSSAELSAVVSRFSIHVTVGADFDKNLGTLLVETPDSPSKSFQGSIDQVKQLLEFITSFVSTELGVRDRLMVSWSDEDVQLAGYDDFDLHENFCWTPSSPTECSDTEKEVFFPDD